MNLNFVDKGQFLPSITNLYTVILSLMHKLTTRWQIAPKMFLLRRLPSGGEILKPKDDLPIDFSVDR